MLHVGRRDGHRAALLNLERCRGENMKFGSSVIHVCIYIHINICMSMSICMYMHVCVYLYIHRILFLPNPSSTCSGFGISGFRGFKVLGLKSRSV